MIDKKEFLLHSIIRAYIENLEPIGSNQLKSMYDISYSPATIRGYFKKLGDEGYLEQEHASSGRIPTVEALKEYWSAKLNFTIDNVDYKKLKTLAYNMGFGIFIQQIHSNRLRRILNIEETYMILEFGTVVENNFVSEPINNSFAVTIKYTPALYRFLTDMVGIELDDIMNIAKQVGATQLYEELNRYIQKSEFEIINIKTFLKFAVHYDLNEDLIGIFLNGSVMQGIKEGVYFENLLPSGFMGVCHSTKISDQDVKLLVVGELSKDYDYFYRGIV